MHLTTIATIIAATNTTSTETKGIKVKLIGILRGTLN